MPKAQNQKVRREPKITKKQREEIKQILSQHGIRPLPVELDVTRNTAQKMLDLLRLV